MSLRKSKFKRSLPCGPMERAYVRREWWEKPVSHQAMPASKFCVACGSLVDRAPNARYCKACLWDKKRRWQERYVRVKKEREKNEEKRP